MLAIKQTEPTEYGLLLYIEELAKLLAAQRRRILGSPGNVVHDPFFWMQEAERMRITMTPHTLNVAQYGAAEVMAQMGVRTGADHITSEIQGWLSGYLFDDIQGINNVTRQALREPLETYFTTTMSKRELIDWIDRIGSFGAARAERIATTETTTAYYEGGRIFQEELTATTGLQSIAVWRTNRDGRVCPICAPRHNTARYPGPTQAATGRGFEHGWETPPPAHVNCRCWVDYFVASSDD